MVKILNNYCSRIFMIQRIHANRGVVITWLSIPTSKTSELRESEKSSISNEFNSFNNCFIIFHSNKMFPAQIMLTTSGYKISFHSSFLGSQDITVCFLYPIFFNSFCSVYLLCCDYFVFTESGISAIFFLGPVSQKPR